MNADSHIPNEKQKSEEKSINFHMSKENYVDFSLSKGKQKSK